MWQWQCAETVPLRPDYDFGSRENRRFTHDHQQRPVQIGPLPFDFHVGFVTLPGVSHMSVSLPPAFLELENVVLVPPKNDGGASEIPRSIPAIVICHHLHEIAIAQIVGHLPAEEE